MKVTCIQMGIQFAEPDANFAHAIQLMEQAMADAPDVLVLPENWNTAFFKHQDQLHLADQNGQRIKAKIGGLAKKYSVNIVAGSISDVRKGKCHNTAYVFDRQGNCIASYDKVHLFSPSGEAPGRRAGAPPLWQLARSFPVTGPQPLSSLRRAGNLK